MTREEAKELLPIIQAFAEGKSIQNKIEGLTGWIDTDEIYPKYDGQKVMYRIKPEPKFRPFKTQEECWNEMLKHQPFGWIRNNDTQHLCNITFINKYGVRTTDSMLYFDHVFNTYNFVDGTPFGIKE